MRGIRSRRRSGISNLIGAIFFVLIVALVLSALIIMFDFSSNYIGGIHTSNQQAVQASNSQVSVSDVAFGGELASKSLALPVNGSDPTPLLPITNMNFSEGLQNWSVSKSYPDLVDAASVSNYLESNDSAHIEQQPVGTYAGLSMSEGSNMETFVLNITNRATLGSGHAIAKVSILVDTDFISVSWGACLTPPTCSGWDLAIPSPSGEPNNLTLTAGPTSNPAADALVSGATALVSWTADVPYSAGNYYHTVVLQWYNTLAVPPTYVDYGTVTATTTITSPLPFPNPIFPTEVLSPRTPGISPGGLVAGYDGNALNSDLETGGGSVDVNFEPNFGGQPLPAGQELSSGAAFTSTFSLSQATICQMRVSFVSGPCGSVTCPVDCTMNATISSDLNEVDSVPNSLVYYHLYLVNPGGTVFAINQDGNDPTVVNHFGPTGWSEQSLEFAPSATFWVPGTYKFELVVNMTMPSGQPSELSMHFGGLGLALNLETPPVDTGGSAYGIGTIPLDFSPAIAYNQAQQVDLALNMSLGSIPSQALTNTVAYVYAATTPVSVLGRVEPPAWYQVASLGFNGSASVSTTLGLPQSTGFVTSPGVVLLKVVVVSVGNGVACQVIGTGTPICTLDISADAVATTANVPQATSQAVFTITNPQGAAAVQLISLIMSGPNGTLSADGSNNGVVSFPLNTWMSAGTTFTVYENLSSQNFLWMPGQVYEVTVTDATGQMYSTSFTAP